MARKYSPSASKDVEREMHKFKRGKLKSGKGGKGGTVKSRKQAVAIGLSEARKKGKKVPGARSRPSDPRRAPRASLRSGPLVGYWIASATALASCFR
jgi:hypothetical protein